MFRIPRRILVLTFIPLLWGSSAFSTSHQVARRCIAKKLRTLLIKGETDRRPPAPVGHALETVPPEVRKQMATDSAQRDNAVVARFKNSVPEGRPPQVVDLTGGPQIPPYLDISRRALDAPEREKLNNLKQVYFQKVGSLRKGDIVTFTIPDEMGEISRYRFRLGKFVGAGNSVHVFELADHPGRAIRIPYTEPLPRLTWNIGTESYSRSAPNIAGVEHIKIFKSEDEFTIVELVEGTESSQSFVQSLTKSKYSRPILSDMVAALRKDSREDAAVKLEKLLFAFRKSGTIGEVQGSTIIDYRRQFTYDRSRPSWILTDWE